MSGSGVPAHCASADADIRRRSSVERSAALVLRPAGCDVPLAARREKATTHPKPFGWACTGVRCRDRLPLRSRLADHSSRLPLRRCTAARHPGLPSVADRGR